MKHPIYIFTFIILTSCHFHGPIDENVMMKITKEPSDAELIGRWEVDSFSYNLIKKQYIIKDQKVELVLNDNGKCHAINFPDFINDGFGKSINGKLINGTGKWTIKPENNTWVLDLEFDNGGLISSSFGLFKKNSELVIWRFIGDPDQADRLMFNKNKNKK
jgi:hypothetical protein